MTTEDRLKEIEARYRDWSDFRWLVDRVRKLEKVCDAASVVVRGELDFQPPALGELNALRAALANCEEA